MATGKSCWVAAAAPRREAGIFSAAPGPGSGLINHAEQHRVGFLVLVPTCTPALSPFPRLENQLQRWTSRTARHWAFTGDASPGLPRLGPCTSPSSHPPSGPVPASRPLHLLSPGIFTVPDSPQGPSPHKAFPECPSRPRLSITLSCLLPSEHLDQPKPPSWLIALLFCLSPSAEMPAA